MWSRDKDEDLDRRQVGNRKIIAHLLPFCMTEMKLLMFFVRAQESRQVRICLWMSFCGCEGVEAGGIVGDDGRSGFLEADDLKTEMMKMGEI